MPEGIETIEDGDSDLKMIKMHAARLGEHFDSVLILVTRHDTKEHKTVQLATGEGNFSARYGLAKEWVLKEEATMARDRRDD